MPTTGYKQYGYWGNETAYGTYAPINQHFGILQTIKPTDKQNTIKVRKMGGNRDYSNIVPGKLEFSGAITFLLVTGAPLRQAFGEDTATTATIDSGPKIRTTGNYLHVMGSANSPGVNSFPSFSLEFTDYEDTGATGTSNLKRTYRGCRVDSLTIKGTVDAPVECTMNYMAQAVHVGTGAATVITETTLDPFVFYQGAVYMTSAAVTSNTFSTTLESSEVANILNFEFSVNNNAEAGYYIGGTTNTRQAVRGPKYIIPKGRDYSAKIGMHFQNKAIYQRFLGSNTATTALATLNKYTAVIDLVRAGRIGSANATDDWMRLVMASATFDDISIDGAPEDIVSQDVTLFVKNTKLYVADTDATYLT